MGVECGSDSIVMEDLVIGVDVGTSAMKLLAVDCAGQVKSRATLRYGLSKSGADIAEQCPDDWWECLRRGLRVLFDDGVTPRSVRAVGVSGQLNGVVLVDADRQPVRDSIIWLDKRASYESDQINHAVGQHLCQNMFSVAGPIHSVSKLVWLQKHEPHVVARAHRVVAPKDYMNLKLSGVFSTDASDASATLMLDLRTRKWDFDMLQEIGLDIGLLPDVAESPTVIGKVTESAALETSLPAGTLVVAGAGDMAALAVGSGTVVEGRAIATIGTAGHIARHIDDLPAHVADGLFVLCHAVPGMYFLHGLVMTAGYCLSWFRDKFGEMEEAHAAESGRDPYDLLTEEASHVAVGSNGLLFLPFMSGVATPHNDPNASGAFIGLTKAHGKAAFVRSVLEGVAYNFRDGFDALEAMGYPALDLRLTEGGSKSPLWCSIMADVLGRNLKALEELESSALGAAILAGVGAGFWPTVPDAVKSAIRVVREVEYSPERNKVYSPYYDLYSQAYRQLRNTMVRIAELENRG